MAYTNFERVCRIVEDRIHCVHRPKLTPETNLVTDLGADSLDMAEIAMDIEDAFSLSYNNLDDLSKPTIGDIVARLPAPKVET